MASFSVDMGTTSSGNINIEFSAKGAGPSEELEVRLTDLTQAKGPFTVEGADYNEPSCHITFMDDKAGSGATCTVAFDAATSLTEPGYAGSRLTSQGYVTADLTFVFDIPAPDDGAASGSVRTGSVPVATD